MSCKEKQGWCFAQDDDAHWYLIPVEQSDNFDSWVYDPDYQGQDFDQYRTDSPCNYTLYAFESD